MLNASILALKRPLSGRNAPIRAACAALNEVKEVEEAKEVKETAQTGTTTGSARIASLVGFALLAGLLAAIVLLPSAHGQTRATDGSTPPQWEIDAGRTMAFEVASVRRSTQGQQGYHANFPLTLGSNFGPVGNLMSVDIPLRVLIGFAFKLSAGQTQFLISGLPAWVDSEWFDVEGRAPISNPSKDQFRLMVQSLLANRFTMATHEEKRELPVYELVLAKPGKTGPQLRPHVGVRCEAQSADAPTTSAAAEFSPFPCGSILIAGAPSLGRAGVLGRVRGGGRDVNLDYIAAFLNGTGMRGTAPDRPVINDTGLTGIYDFWVEFVPEVSLDGVQPDPNGPSFPEALEDQLGLKLIAKTEPVDVMVVDHIEEPSAN